jgi:glycosyltransferase involved in cell wall biosynthesis
MGQMRTGVTSRKESLPLPDRFNDHQGVRVMIVCDFFVKYGSEQALALKGLGHDVGVLLRSHAHEFGGSVGERDLIVSQLADNGVRLFVVPGRVRSLSAVPALLKIRRDLTCWSPQVVHVHENHDPRLVILTRGYRTVFTVHDPTQHPGYRPLTRTGALAFNWWFRRADRFVVHGGALVEELEPLTRGRPIAVIPHGVSVRSNPLSPPYSPTVLLFGRLEQYKGVDVLAAAMPQVWNERPDVRLVVAGAGPAARLVPADARVSLLDRYIPEQDVETLLAQASLVVLPYTQASQSGVGTLAIGAGVPVVVTDLGALPELACDPSFVVEAGNPSALATAIVQHVDDGQSMRSAVLQYARANYSWEHAARLATELYSELIAEDA